MSTFKRTSMTKLAIALALALPLGASAQNQSRVGGHECAEVGPVRIGSAQRGRGRRLHEAVPTRRQVHEGGGDGRHA